MENNLRKPDQFNEHSYGLHANWYNTLYPEKEQKIKVIKSLNSYNGSINHWLQNLFFNCLHPFTKDKNAKWLALGDAYGHDARYLLDQNIQDVTASDLDDSFLKVSHEEEFIKDFSAQNAESLTLEGGSVDYILCKESYHHFPRPYAALYEMIRVARKAMIIIEPQDPISKMPSLFSYCIWPIYWGESTTGRSIRSGKTGSPMKRWETLSTKFQNGNLKNLLLALTFP